MNGTYYRDAAELRRDALSLAVESYRDHRLFPDRGQPDERTKRIVATAGEFERFLRDGAKPDGTDG